MYTGLGQTQSTTPHPEPFKVCVGTPTVVFAAIGATVLTWLINRKK